MKCWGRGLPVLIKRPGRQGGPGEERGAGCSRAWPLSGSLTWAHPEVQLPPQRGEETACPGHRKRQGKSLGASMARAFVPQVTAAEQRSPRGRPCTPLLAVQRSRDAARRRWSVSCFPPSKGRAVMHCGVCLRENKLTSAISDFFRASLAAFGDRGPYGQSVAAPPLWEASRCAPPSALRGPAVTTAPDAPPGTVPGAVTCDSSCPPVRREETHRC